MLGKLERLHEINFSICILSGKKVESLFPRCVIPAKAGIQFLKLFWTPASEQSQPSHFFQQMWTGEMIRDAEYLK